MKRILSLASTILLLSTLAPATFAQSSEGLNLAPVIIERSVESGNTYNLMVKVSGNYNDKKAVDVRLSTFTFKDKSGEPNYTDQTTAESKAVAAWFSYAPLFTLEPRQTTNFPISLKIPENTKPGGYYATVFFEPQNTTLAPVTSGAATKVKMGAHILLTVDEKNTFKKLTLQDVRLSSTESANEETIVFEADIKNEGNVHAVPSGRVEIFDKNGAKVTNLGNVKVKNGSGQIVAEVPSDFLPVNEESMKALPGQLRTVRIPWKLTAGQKLDDIYTVKYLMAEEGKTDFQEKSIQVELRKKLQVENLRLTSTRPLVYGVTLKNTGTVSVVPQLSLSMKDFFSRDTWIELKQAKERAPLLPGQARDEVFSEASNVDLPWIRTIHFEVKDTLGNVLYAIERTEIEWQVYLILILTGGALAAAVATYVYFSKKTVVKKRIIRKNK